MNCDNLRNTCSSSCDPARYSNCDFSIESSPYDASTWLVTNCGVTQRVKVPKGNETDTTLKTNYSNATLFYQAEAHNDTITGEQLGDIINVDDLRNVDIDPSLAGNCYEFIYSKYSDCGTGCTSVADKWHNWNINSEEAKKDYIKYVRGANVYGCPEYLDVPTNQGQYWFAGWKQNGEHRQFGYYQAKSASLPKDSLGNYLVMSQDVNTKEPIIGTLPLDCILGNLVGALGMEVFSTWSVIQATPGFEAWFDTVNGNFQVTWNDWYYHWTRHVGTGHINGKMNWEASFDSTTGHMKYIIHSIYFDRVWWDVDQGADGHGPITLTFKGITIPGGAEVMLLDHYSFSAEASWSQPLGITVGYDMVVDVAPGTTAGPFNFLYVFVDWEIDDEGYLQANFKNKIPSWKQC